MGDEETKNLLKTCAENLLNAVSQLENRPQGSSHVAPMAPAAPVAPAVAGLPVVEEHRRLFGFRPPNNSRASTSSRSGKQPAPKRRMVATSTGEQISIPVRNTWTRTFVCLEKKMQQLPLQPLRRCPWLWLVSKKKVFALQKVATASMYTKKF